MEITMSELEGVADRLDLDYSSIHTTYSGRFMYGASCIGFVIPRGGETNQVQLGIALSDVFGDDAWELSRSVRSDSMGLDQVIYFPGVTLKDDDVDEE